MGHRTYKKMMLAGGIDPLSTPEYSVPPLPEHSVPMIPEQYVPPVPEQSVPPRQVGFVTS